jgi:hypothetical protein
VAQVRSFRHQLDGVDDALPVITPARFRTTSSLAKYT